MESINRNKNLKVLAFFLMCVCLIGCNNNLIDHKNAIKIAIDSFPENNEYKIDEYLISVKYDKEQELYTVFFFLSKELVPHGNDVLIIINKNGKKIEVIKTY